MNSLFSRVPATGRSPRGGSFFPAVACLLAAWSAGLTGSAFAQEVRTWNRLGGGTFDWNTDANWNGGSFPNGINFAAEMGQNYTGDTTILLNGNRTVFRVVLGHNNTNNTIRTRVFNLDAGVAGSRLIINSSGADANLNKVGNGIANVNVPVDILFFTNSNVVGTLNLNGEVNVGGTLNNTALVKQNSGTLNIGGNLTLTGPGIEANPLFSFLHNQGTTNIRGATNTFNNGVLIQRAGSNAPGTINIGSGTINTNTTFLGLTGLLRVDEGTVNFGVNRDTGISAVTNNVTLDIDKITMNGGTLNLRNGNGSGTTTLGAGANNTLTLNGGTVTLYTAAGNAGGTVAFAPNAKLVLNYTANPPGEPQPAATTFNWTSTTGKDHTFVGLDSTNSNTVLRSQAGDGILRIGGDGQDDLFSGSLNMSNSGADSRFIKVGSETLTLAGTINNATSRVQVDAGTLVLAKTSTAGTTGVNAIGASLDVNAGGLVRLGGSFNSFGSLLNSNYNDQIFRNSIVTLNGTGTLDLNGSSEAFDVLLGDGVVTNTAAATTSLLYLGDNNFTISGTPAARTFDGTLINGAGAVGLVKSGNQTLTMTNAGNTFTGPTTVTRATLQLSNDGTLSGTSAITVTRNGTLLLNNTATINANRINNNAAVNMERGTLQLRGHQTTFSNIIESMGALNLNLFSNVVQINHNSSTSNAYVGGTLRLVFDSYNRSPGALVNFIETSTDANAGFGVNPATSNSQVVFSNLPTSQLVGFNGTGPNYSLLIGAFGGARSSASNQFVTMVNSTGNNFIRPLTDADYRTNFANSGADSATQTVSVSNLPTSPATLTSGFDDVAGINVGLTSGVTININANTAFNAFRFAVPSTMQIAEDTRFILGGMDANAGLGTIAFDGTGMALFNAATNIYGGTMYFGNREAILRANSTATTVMNIQSTIEGFSGLTKGGASIVNLLGENRYTGPTWVNEGELGVFTSNALGSMGAANPVTVSSSGTLRLSGGINFGDGTVNGSKDLYLIGENASINVDDRHNAWSGSIFVNPTNAAGQTGFNSILRARGDGVLTIMGQVTSIGADPARGAYNINPSFNTAGQGNTLVLENNLPGTGGGIINLIGQLSDRNGAAASGNGAASAEHDKLNVIIRGYTGVTSPTNSDLTVNIRDATQVNGRLDLRSGFAFIDSDWGTAGKNAFTNGGLIRQHDGSNVDRAGTVSGLFLTQPGTTFRGSAITIAESTGAFSSRSVALLGGTNRTGTVVFGTDTGTISATAITGSSNRSYTSNAVTNANTSTISLTPSSTTAINLRVGYGVTGPNIQPGTLVTAISGNIVTLSKPLEAQNASGTSYNFGILPISNVAATGKNPEPVVQGSTVIVLDSVTNFVVGQGISGPGIPAGTTITAVNTGLNSITISNATTAINNTVDSEYRSFPVGQNTMTLSTTAGLRVGMPLVNAAVPAGTFITGISGNTVTLSAPINSIVNDNATIAFPLAQVNYRSGTGNNSGSNQLNFVTVEGLTVGTIIKHANIPEGTTITAIDVANNRVTLSNNTTGTINSADVNVQKVSNFNEVRLYAAPGGSAEFRTQILDDTGYSINNAVAALSKVGRGTVNLLGSAAGGNSLDGGINLFGGTLIFDYTDQTAVDPGEEDLNNPEFARDFSRISQGSANSPHQLTLGGGTIKMMDADAANITESARGRLFIRPGHSKIEMLAGNTSQLRLNLGYHNPFPEGNTSHYWRAPDRFAGGTMHFEYANVPVAEIGGTAIAAYSQNAKSFANDSGVLGYDAILPYATVAVQDALLGRVVDFASFVPITLANGQLDTYFGDSSGFISNSDLFDAFSSGIGNDLSTWDSTTQFGKGYVSDDYTSQFFGTGFLGQLTPNFNSDFRGVRVVRFASSTSSDNVLNLGSTRLVLGTASALDPFLSGGAVQDGGAILISNVVSRIIENSVATPVINHQFVRGGSLTSATPSTYFSNNVQLGAFTRDELPAATSTDLIIHNHNELGSFSIESPLVNFQPGTPLNLVVTGPGLTRLAPTSTSTFSGATYVSDGTLWLAASSALGTSSSAMVYLNGGTLEWANTTPANRATSSIFPVMATGRPLVLGGNGGFIKTTAPGTVVNFGGVIRSEDNILAMQLSEHRLNDNIGVGDLIKTGLGRLVISNGTTTGSAGWNAYYGLTEVLEGALEVRIGNVNSGILGSNYSYLDGTLIASGARLDLQITGGAANGTNEWFDLDGGTLGTTALHTDGSLNGVIRFTDDSTIDVTQGTLRLNPTSGMVEGSGKMTKTGEGTLMLFENNITFTGEIEVKNGLVQAVSQGLPFGSGNLITLGDNGASASGTAGLLLQARTADSFNYKAIYQVLQDLVVRAEGGAVQQEKVIGVTNTGTGTIAGGAPNDRYEFRGDITLNDNLTVRYSDVAANVALNPTVLTGNLRGGGNRIIALGGNLTGAGNLQTEVIQTGGTVNGADNDQLVYFELGGNNSAWTGGIRLGNRGAVDADRQHFLRLMNPNATNGSNSVTLDFNATLQVGGGNRVIGSLVVGDPTGNALTNQVIVENAATSFGTLTINQTVDAEWRALFRNGSTPNAYFDFDNATASTVLNLIKTGPAVATMTQANTYTGFTQIGTANGASGGTLRLGVGGSIVTSSPLTVFAGTFELSGVNHTLTQPLLLGGGATGTRAAVQTNTNTLTLGNNVVFNATNNPAGASISGSVQMGSVQRTFNVGNSTHANAGIDLDVNATVLGTGGLLKSGPGTMAISRASTYTGGTTVSEGALLAMNSLGSAFGSGPVTVQPGATLGGVGFIGGDVTLSGTVGNEAILAPGSPTISSGIELLSLNGSLTLEDHTIIDFYLGQTGWTKLFANTISSVSSTTSFRVNLNAGYTPTAGASFDLLDWNTFLGGGDTNWLDNLILPSLPPGSNWDTSLFTSQGLLSIAGSATGVSILAEPLGKVTDPGIPVELSVGLSGTEPWLLQWQKLVGVDQWQDVPGATDTTFRIESPQESDEGTYRVVVSNAVNTVTSATAFLEVTDTPTILSFTRNPATGNLNPGQSVTFTVNANNATTYEWRRGTTVVATTTHPTNFLTISSLAEVNQGIYTVLVSNSAGGVLTGQIELIVNDPPQIVTPPVNRLGALGNIVTFSVVATGSPTPTYQWQFKSPTAVAFTNINGQTSPSLQRTVSTGASGTVGEYQVVITNEAGTVTTTPVTLSQVGGDVNIVTQPQHKVLRVGEPLVLECDATGADPLRFQWRRNGVNISGATSRTFSVASATTARGGIYTCVVSNRNNGQGQATSQTSNEARVLVADTSPRRVPVRLDRNVTLTLSAGGPVTFQWFFDNLQTPGGGEEEEGPSDNFVSINGATAANLTLTKAQPSNRGHYRCRVSLMDANNQVLGFLDGGINDVLVYNEKPVIEDFSFPDTVISEPYGDTTENDVVFFQVPFDDDPAKAPTGFTARGLPPGLRIDSLGRVTGRATATIFPAEYSVTVTASNLVGPSDSVTKTLKVNVLNGNLIGSFTGPINPNTAINGDLGGRIDFTTTKTGSVSGSVVLGATTLRFRTVFNTQVSDLNAASIDVNLTRKGATPLRLVLVADAATNRIVSGSLTDTADEDITTQVGGWRSTWVKTKDVPKPAAAIEGYYTFQMEIPVALRHQANTPLLPTDPKFKIPQGFGFGSFTINGATGRTTVALTTPDGTKATSATFAGPLFDDNDDTIADKHELLVFRTLYASNARGSVVGVVKIGQAAQNINNTVDGAVNWWRPATPSTKHRLYRDGFDAMDLTVDGSRYDGPKKQGLVPPIVMNLDPFQPVRNSKVTFLHANVESAVPGANFVDVLVNTANRAFIANTNDRKVSLTINEATGVLGGSFTLSEVNPFPPNPSKPATIRRTVRYSGLIVKSTAGFRGVGQYNLNQLPLSTTESPSQTPTLSGQMLFTKEN